MTVDRSKMSCAEFQAQLPELIKRVRELEKQMARLNPETPETPGA